MTFPLSPFSAATARNMPPADAVSAGPARQHEAARQLSQMFLEEMLKHAGPGPISGAFSGGVGEEQFASFLTREHADILSRRLDLGFAASLAPVTRA